MRDICLGESRVGPSLAFVDALCVKVSSGAAHH